MRVSALPGVADLLGDTAVARSVLASPFSEIPGDFFRELVKY